MANSCSTSACRMRCTVDFGSPVACAMAVTRSCSGSASSTASTFSIALPLPGLLLIRTPGATLPGQPTAIDDQQVPADVVGGGRGEEHRGADQVGRHPPAAGRDPVPDGCLPAGLRAQRPGVVGGDVAGGDGVDL